MSQGGGGYQDLTNAQTIWTEKHIFTLLFQSCINCNTHMFYKKTVHFRYVLVKSFTVSIYDDKALFRFISPGFRRKIGAITVLH